MRILVTGAAGFIGSHYVRTLIGGGYPGYENAEVTVVDSLTYAGNLANLSTIADSPRFRFVRGDIADGALLADVVPGHDAIVNFAACTHVDRSITAPTEFVRSNVLGFQAICEAARNHNLTRVVHVGTDEVYGSIEYGSWTENSALLPNSPYSASKASAELIARAYHQTYGLNVCTTRGTNTYGPYQHPEKVIPLFITRLLRGQRVPLYGTGDNVRDWLHVDDHCRGIHLILDKGEPGHSYNLGTGQELSNTELTDLILTELGADWSAVDRVPDRPGHDLRYSVDYSQAEKLGYRPRQVFIDGLAQTIDWYRTHRDWWEPLTSHDGAQQVVPSGKE